MEFNWTNPPFNLDPAVTLPAIEESIEDPFAVRLLPDSPRFSVLVAGALEGGVARGLILSRPCKSPATRMNARDAG